MGRDKSSITAGGRIARAFTPEGMLIGGLSALMILALFPILPSPYTLILVLVIALPAFAILWASLETGKALIQWLFSAGFGLYVLFVVAAMGAGESIEIPFLASAFLVFVCLELFHIHNLRMRNSAVESEMLVTNSLWIVSTLVVSIIISILTLSDFPESNQPSWLFVPFSAFVIFAFVTALTVGPLRNLLVDSSERWDPSKRLPPAPADVDPLVAQAKAATRYQVPSSAPPPPDWKSTRF